MNTMPILSDGWHIPVRIIKVLRLYERAGSGEMVVDVMIGNVWHQLAHLRRHTGRRTHRRRRVSRHVCWQLRAGSAATFKALPRSH